MTLQRPWFVAALAVGLFLTLACARESGAREIPEAVTAPAPVADCQIFPPDNIWNARVDSLPLHPRSDDYVDAIGRSDEVHADFGSGEWDGGPIGIPFVVVGAAQPLVPIGFHPDGWPDESDTGPAPVPADAPIEGGPASDGDRHVLVLRQDDCRLFELYRAFPRTDGGWEVMSSAYYDLSSHALRPDGWTSADAAGLPVFPGLVRYEEVQSGAILHAIRFTAPETQRAYVWPARHFASDNTAPEFPPMGQRFRLKAGVDIGGFSPQVQVILRAMKEYGIILADNGSPWYISGAPHPAWNNDMLHEMDVLSGDDFEAVDVSSLMLHPDSGQVRPPVALDHSLYLPVARN